MIVSTVTLTDSERILAVGRLTSAFENDPWLLMLSGGQRDKISAFFDFVIQNGIHTGQQFLKIYPADNPYVMAGFAVVEPPRKDQKTSKWHYLIFILRYFLTLDFKAFKRLNAYMRQTTKHRPKTPHHYLVCVGIAPEHQGKHLGKEVLDYLHTLSANHPLSTGVGLDTENDKNIGYYEKNGYRFTATESLEALSIYTFFRENR